MWYAALTIGLAGSLHCAGMCGPLMIAVTQQSRNAAIHRVLYNIGRITTYGLLGAMFGGMNVVLNLSKYQGSLSLLFGLVLIIVALSRSREGFRLPVLTKLTTSITIGVKNAFPFLLRKNNRTSVFLLGMLNGILPCGMLVVALSYCLLLEGSLQGFLFMLLFGLGTFPVMLGLGWILTSGIQKVNISANALTQYLLLLSGVMLVGRFFFQEGLSAMYFMPDAINAANCP